MSASLSHYVPGVGRVASKPVGDSMLDPPTDRDADDRMYFESIRWDRDEALLDDFRDGIEAILCDDERLESLKDYLRDRDECALGLMLRVAAQQARENYVEDHFRELQQKQRMGDL